VRLIFLAFPHIYGDMQWLVYDVEVQHVVSIQQRDCSGFSPDSLLTIVVSYCDYDTYRPNRVQRYGLFLYYCKVNEEFF